MSVLKVEFKEAERKFYQLFDGAVKNCGLEIYDLRYVESTGLLKIFIINPKTKTATLDDCVAVDRKLTECIESASFIKGPFTLEVSSPGINRDLNSVKHFIDSKGSNITFVFKDGKKKTLELLDADQQGVKVLDEDVKHIPYGQIARANFYSI